MCYNYHTLHCCALLHSNADVCKHLDRNGNNVLWVHCTWMNCLCRLIQPPWRQEPGCSHRSRECQRNDGTEGDLFLQACGGPPKCVLSFSRMGTWPPWTWMSLGSQVCNFVQIRCCPVEPNYKDEEKLSYKTDSTNFAYGFYLGLCVPLSLNQFVRFTVLQLADVLQTGSWLLW